MKKQQLSALIGFIIGFIVCLVSVALTNQTPHFKEHSKDVTHMHMGTILVEESIPTIEIESTRISKNNVDIQLKVTNFRFAPENADGEHKEGEGHAHIYVNEQKIGRVYGEWFHIPNLPPGKHVVRVNLNTNDHRTYNDAKGPIGTSVEIEI